MANVMEARRRILLNTPHIETASGGVANFKTDMIAPLKECKVNFLPKQSGSGDPSPTNIRPISGWDEVTVTRCGKNLLNTDYSAWSLRGSVYAYINDVVPKGQTARFTFIDKDTTADILGCYIGFVYEDLRNALPTSYSWIIDNGTVKRYSNVAVNGMPGLLCQNVMIYPQTEQTLQRLLARFYIMVELGSTATTTYEPYAASTFPISWTQQSTVYGGYVDLVSGELVAEWVKKEVNGTEPVSSFSERTNTSRMYVRPNPYVKPTMETSIHLYAENMPVFAPDYQYRNDVEGVSEYKNATVGGLWVAIDNNKLSELTRDGLKAYLAANPITVCYQLETPTLITTLTTQQLKTLKGINNVYSDAGSTEVKFWTH